ncbi:hypothetical protein O988_07179 [Pseudogymnoascus sp. VKM F-3808]|nr:hypothetical protein O988_07179 [Pseudogymnoascus sp. VKM F-3808]
MAAQTADISPQDALKSMISIMTKIHKTAHPLILRHNSSQEADQFVNERRLILRQLNGRAWDWDNLDVGAPRCVVGNGVNTSDRFADCGVGLGISLMKLRAATEVVQGMELVCQRAEVLMGLVEGLKDAYTVVMRFAEDVGGWDVEHAMSMLEGSADARRMAVKELMDVMDTWNTLGQWLDYLMVVREAVVSEREEMVDKKEGMELDAAKNPIKAGSGQLN